MSSFERSLLVARTAAYALLSEALGYVQALPRKVSAHNGEMCYFCPGWKAMKRELDRMRACLRVADSLEHITDDLYADVDCQWVLVRGLLPERCALPE